MTLFSSWAIAAREVLREAQVVESDSFAFCEGVLVIKGSWERSSVTELYPSDYFSYIYVLYLTLRLLHGTL